MPNFGASFKKARESKGIPLDRISTETRISARFLQAIENEDFHLLPGGIFNRGFIRTYAERLGLDPEQAVADYEKLTEVRAPSEPVVPPRAPARKVNRQLYPAAIGGLILVIVIFYIVTRDSGSVSDTASLTPAPISRSETPSAQPATVTQSAPVTQPAPAPEVAATAPQPAASTPPTTSTDTLTRTPSTDALTLDVEAKETTWIKVMADDKSILAGEILEPGATRRFTAQTSIEITIGNAGGLSLKLNNRPVNSIGQSGQVRKLVITPQNLSDFTG
jgi:cytoskeletal protein RodZ